MIRQTLLTNWGFMRWFRLGMGILIGIQAYQMNNALAGFISAILLFQAITNTGCCGSGGCSIPSKKANAGKVEDVEFENIK